MSENRSKKYDILAVGELLIDFISTDFADNLDEVQNFKRLLGGSPANMCMNMARLGNSAKLLASLGNDDMGRYVANRVLKRLSRAGVPGSAARIGVLGLTFKENVADCRNSRVPDIIAELESFGVTVLAFDPMITVEEARHELGVALTPLDVTLADHVGPRTEQPRV